MRFGLPPAIAAAAVSIGLRIFGVLASGGLHDAVHDGRHRPRAGCG
jgi:hypothetical protein